MEHFSLDIVIPIGPGDLSWQPLLGNLGDILKDPLLPKIRIILSYCEEDKSVFLLQLEAYKKRKNLYIISVASQRGRSHQLNKGAQTANGEFLWFLHADSKLEKESLIKLFESLRDDPEALHYFNLLFLGDGPFLTCLNEWGARVRSEALKIPFGDQGLCIKREVFWSLNGFLPGGEKMGGEDHLFIWEARKKGLKLRNTGGFLATSARKYKANGWLRTTLYHIYLTYKVAIYQWYLSKLV